jgi:CheY-like chemotaxis protein
MELADDLPEAWGDAHQMEQVLLNLIVNAEDAIADVERRPGSIHIRTGAAGGRMQLTVTDNGSGIHARDMARIFDPFFTTKDQMRGTGLGLSICAEIIRNHGGELYAWSTYGGGSTFTLELPIRAEIEREEDRPVKNASSQNLQDRSILVIDDEMHIRELMFDVLTQQGAQVDVAGSGMDALEMLKKKSYDVIVCDQRMPGISGQRLYRLTASLNPELQHRFLFVTGDVVNVQTKRFVTQAGVQFIRKPFRIQDLLEAIDIVANPCQLQSS